MHHLFEKSDSLNTPIECFIFNVSEESFPVRPHWHYFDEIIYILEGSADMRSWEDKYILNEGDMILFHSRSIHSIFAADSRPLVYAVLKFDINKLNVTSAYAPKLRNIFKQAEQQKMNIFFSSAETQQMGCRDIFNKCLTENQSRKYGYDLLLQANIYTLLMEMIRNWLKKGLLITNCAPSDNYDIDSVTEYIDSAMSENLKAADIADKCGMSYSCFAKKFKEIYGMSCKEYIERMRIFKVEEFLLFTDYDLSYISRETGFSDCSHLIKSFRNLRGITPKQFRLKNRK